MAKPDPTLLDPARYPFRCSIETRYRDLDSNLHLNNGVMASLLEEGRVRFHRKADFRHLSGHPDESAMVVSLAIEFLGQSHFPQPLEISVGFARVGKTSYDLAQLVTQADKVVVFATATLVVTRHAAPFAITADQRAIAEQWSLRT
jgi:acyl-CoA thioester hydrolase